MNRIYRVVWNSATHSWAVASEMAKGRKKSSVSKVAKVFGLAIAVAAGSNALISAADAQVVTVSNLNGSLIGIPYSTIRTSFDESTLVNTSLVPVGQFAQAWGPTSTATGSYSMAIGNLSAATADDTTAVGTNASAAGQGSTVVGYRATSTAAATNSVALGANATVTAMNSVALGANSTTTTDLTQPAYNPFDVALGGQTAAGEVSVGSATQQRRLTNVAAGSAMTDAVNVSQLQSVAAVAGAGWTLQANGQNPGVVGPNGVSTVNIVNGVNTAVTYNPVSGNLEVDVIKNPTFAGLVTAQKGLNMSGTVISNVADGVAPTDAVNVSQLAAASSGAGAVKYDVNADTSINYNSVTLGNGAVSNDGGLTGATKLSNVAQGYVSSDSTDAVNGAQLYQTNQAVTQNTTDITNLGNTVTDQGNQINSIYTTGTQYFHANSTGPDSAATGTDSVAIGTGAVSSNANDVALGASSTTAAAVATTGATIGGTNYSFAGATPTSTLSVGSAGNERTITNVAAGRISAESTDAVNGSELFATNQAVDQNTTDIANMSTTVNNINNGGGVKYFHANSILADASATGTNSVAVGPQAVSSAANSVALGNGAVASTDNSVALGAGSTTGAVQGTGGATIAGNSYTFAGSNPTGTVSVGAAGQERTVSNVAAGQLSADSTDAVNGSQLYATNQAVNGLSTQVTNVSNAVNNVTGNITNLTNGQAGMFQVSADNNTPAPSPTGTQSLAGGAGSVASGASSMAVGNGSQATASNTTAVGNGAQATASNAVAIGAGSVATRANTVSVGTAGGERQITNVAAGTQGTDAVNVNQLQSAQAGTVHYDTNVDGSANYNSVTLNSGGSSATLHNVAAGAAPSDAVNVGQLNAGINQAQNWSKTYTDQQVDSMGNRAFAGVASAIAATNLPQAYQPNQSSAGVALGSFHGQTGIAFGVSTISESGRYVFKASASTDSRGDAGVGVGAGMVW